MKDVGAFFFIENEGDEMRCETCGSLLTEDNAVVKLIDENLEYKWKDHITLTNGHGLWVFIEHLEKI